MFWHPLIIIYYAVYQNLSGGLGGAFFVQGSGPTLADLLQSILDHSYTEGESIFADLGMTLVSQYCSINCRCNFIIISAFIMSRTIRLTEVNADDS